MATDAVDDFIEEIDEDELRLDEGLDLDRALDGPDTASQEGVKPESVGSPQNKAATNDKEVEKKKPNKLILGGLIGLVVVISAAGAYVVMNQGQAVAGGNQFAMSTASSVQPIMPKAIPATTINAPAVQAVPSTLSMPVIDQNAGFNSSVIPTSINAMPAQNQVVNKPLQNSGSPTVEVVPDPFSLVSAPKNEVKAKPDPLLAVDPQELLSDNKKMALQIQSLIADNAQLKTDLDAQAVKDKKTIALLKKKRRLYLAEIARLKKGVKHVSSKSKQVIRETHIAGWTLKGVVNGKALFASTTDKNKTIIMGAGDILSGTKITAINRDLTVSTSSGVLFIGG